MIRRSFWLQATSVPRANHDDPQGTGLQHACEASQTISNGQGGCGVNVAEVNRGSGTLLVVATSAVIFVKGEPTVRPSEDANFQCFSRCFAYVLEVRSQHHDRACSHKNRRMFDGRTGIMWPTGNRSARPEVHPIAWRVRQNYGARACSVVGLRHNW